MDSLITVGWREWVGLPALDVPRIKAKIDTGARTSALHAFRIERFRRRGVEMVRFEIHPYQRRSDPAVPAEASLLEMRRVRSSSGHAALRPVIRTRVELMGTHWDLELTLASRDTMGFRMLLGRQAIRGRCLVDPARSFLAGKPRQRRTGKSRRKGKSR